ncbi:MAG: efflux RND transporter periplasmic adaptor subunit, partial [Acidobacteriota bacterium]
VGGHSFPAAAAPADAAPWIGVVLPLEAIDVAAETSGRLQAVEVRAGTEVEQGQVLARLDSKTAEGNHKIAVAELEMAEAELARSDARSRQESSRHARRSTTPELFSEEELSSTEVDARSAEADKRAAEARVESARANVEQLREGLDRMEVRAPFAGHISLRYLDPGEVVTSGESIVRLVSNQALLVRFAVPPGDLEGLALGQVVAVLSAEGNPIGEARVRRISPEIDLASQRIFAEAILDADSLRIETKGGFGVEVQPAASGPGAGLSTSGGVP